MRAPESTELVALDIFARAEIGRTFEIVGTIFTLCGLVNAWRRSTNRIRNAVDVIVEEIKIRVLRWSPEPMLCARPTRLTPGSRHGHGWAPIAHRKSQYSLQSLSSHQ